jgi:hypothetical protein
MKRPAAAASEDSDAASRNTFTGNADDLAEAFVEVAGSLAFCTYPDETALVSKAALHIESALAHSELLQALHNVQANLSFPKSTLEAALGLIVHKNNLKIKAADVADWITTLSRRMRNMCRCVGQADSRPSPPSWVLKLPWRDGEVTATQPKLATKAEKKPQKEADESKHVAKVTIGWNAELMLAWRKADGKPLELSLPIQCDEKSSGISLLKAVFQNGDEESVPGMTREAFRLLTRQSHKAGVAMLWEGEVLSTHHKVQILQKVDRNLLAIITEQSHQVLQVRIDAFGDVVDQKTALDRSDPILQKAVAFLTTIATQYCAGTLERKNLMQERDKAMKILKGDLKPSRKQRKRPAAPRKTSASSSKHPKVMNVGTFGAESPGGDEDEDDEPPAAAEDEEAEDDEDDEDDEPLVEAALKRPARPAAAPARPAAAPARKTVLKRPAAAGSTSKAASSTSEARTAMTMPMASADEKFEQFWNSN